MRTNRPASGVRTIHRLTVASHGPGLLLCAPDHSQFRRCSDQECVSRGRSKAFGCAGTGPTLISSKLNFPAQFRAGKVNHVPSLTSCTPTSWLWVWSGFPVHQPLTLYAMSALLGTVVFLAIK